MRIIISDVDTGEVEISFQKSFHDEQDVTFPEVYGRLMAALEGIVNTFIDSVPATDGQAFKEHLFNTLDGGFANFLYKVFPDIDPGEFDLSDAAIVYAQDQIINKAEAEGKSYKEMLQEYEALADAYVASKREN